jgi:DNA-binding transcriptional ArsR family regulator
MAKQVLDSEKLECMANRLKALANPVRISIVNLLQKHGKLSVGEIQKSLKMEQASTSNHLKVLKNQQILSSAREGKNKYYSLRDARISAIISCIEKCND